MMSRSLLAVSAFAVAVQAHFMIMSPVPRDPYNEDTMTTFCDGAPTGPRTEFPIGPGVISLMSSHDTTNITAKLTLKSDPSSVTDFTSVLKGPYVHTGAGDLCFGVDISSLNLEGACDGVEATIQISNTMTDAMGMVMDMYQCADVVLKHTANTATPVCATID